MSTESARAVREMWELFEARSWAAAGRRLADDFVCEWPGTGERFRGREAFLAMNQAHPAPHWHIAVNRVVAGESEVAAEVVVRTDDSVDVCLGFYEVSGGRIRHAVEYWTEQRYQPTPAWREAWTERIGWAPITLSASERRELEGGSEAGSGTLATGATVSMGTSSSARSQQRPGDGASPGGVRGAKITPEPPEER